MPAESGGAGSGLARRAGEGVRRLVPAGLSRCTRVFPGTGDPATGLAAGRLNITLRETGMITLRETGMT
jgi:hypothetical protein